MTRRGPRNVVLVHRYFWPDTPPYASMLRALARRLTDEGHRVTVLTCQPSYRPGQQAWLPRQERDEGYDVVRWSVLGDRLATLPKVLNMVVYCLRLLTARRHWRHADVIVAATTPPILVAMVCSVMARIARARFIYHRQDIYPEVVGRGRTPARRLLLAGLRRVDAATDRRAWRSVALSRDMAETISARSGGRARTVVLNNFDPWPVSEPSSDRTRTPSAERLDIVFAGNLGRFQGAEYLLDLIARTASEPRITWHVFGEGALHGRFQAAAEGGARITLRGHQPPEVVATFVRERAHLGVVSLNPGVVRAAYPSRTMTYLRQGCPLLAIVETDSELAEMVTGERLGIVGGHHDIPRLAALLGDAAHEPAALLAARRRAIRTYHARFAAERQLARWVELVELA